MLDGCVLWRTHVLVPPPGQHAIPKELHETHTSMSKMKSLAQSCIWCPGVDSDIEQCVKKCSCSQETALSSPTAQLHLCEWPGSPWRRLHLYLAGPFQDHVHLVIVGAHFKWLEVKLMKSITTAKHREVFSTHGLPKTVVTENRPLFTNDEFATFMRKN